MWRMGLNIALNELYGDRSCWVVVAGGDGLLKVDGNSPIGAMISQGLLRVKQRVNARDSFKSTAQPPQPWGLSDSHT